jgi:hypothetical protein
MVAAVSIRKPPVAFDEVCVIVGKGLSKDVVGIGDILVGTEECEGEDDIGWFCFCEKAEPCGATRPCQGSARCSASRKPSEPNGIFAVWTTWAVPLLRVL